MLDYKLQVAIVDFKQVQHLPSIIGDLDKLPNIVITDDRTPGARRPSCRSPRQFHDIVFGDLKVRGAHAVPV
jgi:hypothetical protein